jgi:hypothetical protein
MIDRIINNECVEKNIMESTDTAIGVKQLFRSYVATHMSWQEKMKSGPHESIAQQWAIEKTILYFNRSVSVTKDISMREIAEQLYEESPNALESWLHDTEASVFNKQDDRIQRILPDIKLLINSKK